MQNQLFLPNWTGF